MYDDPRLSFYYFKLTIQSKLIKISKDHCLFYLINRGENNILINLLLFNLRSLNISKIILKKF